MGWRFFMPHQRGRSWRNSLHCACINIQGVSLRHRRAFRMLFLDVLLCQRAVEGPILLQNECQERHPQISFGICKCFLPFLACVSSAIRVSVILLLHTYLCPKVDVYPRLTHRNLLLCFWRNLSSTSTAIHTSV